MVLSIARKNTSEFFTPKIWLVVIVFSVFTLSTLQSARILDSSYLEFILTALSEHYYIIYFMVPIYVAFVFMLLNSDNCAILIRSKRYINYFLSQVISLLVISSIFVFTHLFIAIILGYGLRFDNVFTLNGNCPFHEVFLAYSNVFKTPLVTLFVIVIYWVTGLTFIGIMLLVLNHYLNKKLALTVIGASYLLMMAGLRSNIDDKIPFIFINNYVILHHAIAVLGSNYYYMFASKLVIISAALLLVKKYWYKGVESL
ncbi:MAG: hypothetical protein ACLKAN_12915 [Alkaliphilus sp.]